MIILFRLIKFIIVVSLFVLISATILIGGVYFYFAHDLPSLKSIDDYKQPIVSEVFSDDGTKIGEFWIQRRIPVKYNEIPKLVINAFLASEDARFFEHKGVDIRGIVRAFYENLKAGHIVQGGSTITQQITRSMFLSRERSYKRKIKEAILATRIDRTLSKEEILEIYMNDVFLGNRAYGIKAAAENYFHKDLKDLTLAEATMLAGLTQSPSVDNPLVNPKNAKERQRYVLNRMAELGFISKKEADAAYNEPLTVYVASLDKEFNARYAPYFTEEVRRILLEKYGDKVVYEGGLKIYTTVDLSKNLAAETALRHGLEDLDHRRNGYRGPIGHISEDEIPSFLAEVDREARLEEGVLSIQISATNKEKASTPTSTPLHKNRYWRAVVTGFGEDGTSIKVAVGYTNGVIDKDGYRWAATYIKGRPSSAFSKGDIILVEPTDKEGIFKLAQVPKPQGAIFSLEPKTGFVRAMVGGFDFRLSEFNRATQALRQPGSSFKPIIYAAALDKGYNYSTHILDAPVSYKVGDEIWTPKNYGGGYAGDTTFESDLVYSRNVPTVKIVESIGTHYLTAYARKMGLTNQFYKYLSMALGANSVYLSEMTTAFSTFANYGVLPKPVMIKKVVYSNGKVIEEYTPPPPPMSPEEAFEYAKSVDLKAGELNSALYDANKEWIKKDGLKLSDEEIKILYGRVIPDGYVITPQTAYLMLGLMRGVVERGTGTRVKALGRPVAGKTGTSNDEADTWFIGFVPQLAAGVWVGNDTRTPLGSGEQGGRTAAPIFLEYMKEATKDMPPLDFEKIGGLKPSMLAELSGGSAVYYTGASKPASAAWFGVSRDVRNRGVDFFEEESGF